MTLTLLNVKNHYNNMKDHKIHKMMLKCHIPFVDPIEVLTFKPKLGIMVNNNKMTF